MAVSISIQKAIDQMINLKNRGVTYSMYGSRTGTDGTADCSGAVYASLRTGGASDAGYVLSTETMHAWLISNGFKLIAENKEWNAQKGDVFMWGKRGQSAGAGGHTGIFVDANNIIHCNYGRNGVTIDNHDAIWAQSGRMYWYAYRYQGTAPTPPTTQKPTKKKKGEIEMKCTFQVDNKAQFWYFDGTNVKALNATGEVEALRMIYKDNNGHDMPHYKWSSKAPWYIHLMDVASRDSATRKTKF